MSHSVSEVGDVVSEGDDLVLDGPLFPYQKLYHDAADKARIDKMTELDREEALAQRAGELERHEQDNELRRLMASRKQSDKKRKADDADLEESQRKSSRQRTKLGGGRAGEASTAIAAYKQQRAEKELRDQQRRSGGPARRAPSEDNFSDDDADGESEDYEERRYKRRSPTPIKDDPVAELSDVQRARIGRDNFAQVCETPGFEATATGCFARVCLGPGRVPGMNEYRLCSIARFQPGRPYAMTDSSKRTFLTDRYIVAAHGKAEKPWTFLECSMSRFTDEEWRRYKLTMVNEDCQIPTRGQIAKKLDLLDKVINHKWSSEDIDKKMSNRRALTNKVNRADERDDIQDALTEARRNNDDLAIEELEEKLANIVPMKLALNTTFGGQAKKQEVKTEVIKKVDLNSRNAQMASDNIRKAQLAEMHKRKAKKHLAPGVDELFEGGSDISRAGTPVNGHSTPKLGASISRSGTPNPMAMANGTPRAGTPTAGLIKPIPRSGTPLASVKKPGEEKKKGIPVIRKAAADDDILASMDLGIDI